MLSSLSSTISGAHYTFEWIIVNIKLEDREKVNKA